MRLPIRRMLLARKGTGAIMHPGVKRQASLPLFAIRPMWAVAFAWRQPGLHSRLIESFITGHLAGEKIEVKLK